MVLHRRIRWMLLAGLLAVPAFAQESPEPESAPPAELESVPVTVEPEPEPEVEAEGTRLDTIQVTASKAVKPQRDIPGSVGAIRGEDLEQMRAQGMRDYLKTVPGVLYADTGNEEGVPIIRGISTSLSSTEFTAATTGVYLEEMPFADLFITLSLPDLNPFDLDRVEVLKGPQGTLFGSGALAGAVRYLVHKPEFNVWQAKLSQTVLSSADSVDQSKVTAGAVNIPVFGDRLALRAVGVFRKDAGQYDMSAQDTSGNTLRDDPDADTLEQESVRFMANWDVSDALKIDGFYFGQKTHQDDVAYANGDDAPSFDRAPFASPRDHDFGGGNLLATYDFSWGRLLSSTNRMTKHNYIDAHQEFGASLGQQNSQEFFGVFGSDTRGFTQEVRLASPAGAPHQPFDWMALEWLVGGSYLNYDNAFWQFTWLGAERPDPQRPEEVSDADKAAGQVFATLDQIGVERAAFGEATARLGDYWEATVGARAYRTDLDVDSVICGAQIAALFPGQTCHTQKHLDQAEGINPKYSLRYLHSANVQWYALAAKGFQFGGVQVNPPAPGFEASAEQAGFHFGPFKSSNLWNYEAGLRTEWMDRRLRFDLAFFYLDWKDLQLTVPVPLQGTNVSFGVIVNVGRAHSEGVEASLDVIPFPGARWTSSAAWVSALTDEVVVSSAGQIPPGTRLPGAPRFHMANVASYEHSLPYFTSWKFGPALTHTYIGEAMDGLIPTGTIGGYSTFDARFALVNSSWRFQPELSFGVNNLTNVRARSYHQGGNSITDGSAWQISHFIQPRTAVMSLSLRY